MSRPTKEASLIARHRKVRDQRQDRLTKHYAKLALLRDLLTTYEQQEDFDEARHTKRRIRTLEQQIRYMGGDVP